MLCPYCGKEMEKGLIQSARPIFWSIKKKKMFFIASSAQGDISIAKGGNGCVREAFLCKDCNKIQVDLMDD